MVGWGTVSFYEDGASFVGLVVRFRLDPAAEVVAVRGGVHSMENPDWLSSNVNPGRN